MVLPVILVGVGFGFAGFVAGRRRSGRNAIGDSPREREIRKWRKRESRFGPEREAAATQIDDVLAAKRLDNAPTHLLESPRLGIENESGQEVLSIATISDPGVSSWNEVKDEVNPISRLNPLLSAVPNLGISGHVLSSNYAIVNIPLRELVSAKDGVGRRAIVHVGKISENARLFSPDKLTKIVSAAAIWEIMSVAVAQKHLHDINKRLGEISRQLDEVAKFQKEERSAKIEATLRVFSQTMSEMETYGASHVSVDHIESRMADISEVELHVRKQIERRIEQGAALYRVGPECNEYFEDLPMLLKELFLCFVVQLLGCKILVVLSEDPSFLRNRIDMIQSSVEESIVRYIVANFQIVLGVLSKETSSCSSGRRKECLDVIAKFRKGMAFESIVHCIDREVSVARNALEQQSAPASILLKVSGGRIDGFAIAKA